MEVATKTCKDFHGNHPVEDVEVRRSTVQEKIKKTAKQHFKFLSPNKSISFMVRSINRSFPFNVNVDRCIRRPVGRPFHMQAVRWTCWTAPCSDGSSIRLIERHQSWLSSGLLKKRTQICSSIQI